MRILFALLKKNKRQEMFSSIRLVFYTKYTSGIFNADTRFLFTAKGSINYDMSATLYIIRRIYTWINTLYIQIFCIFVKSLIFSNRQYAKIQGTCFKLQAIYFEIHALSFLLNALYGFDWRKNILKSRNKWIYATDVTSFIAYTFTKKNSIVHNSTLEKELFLFVLFYGENVFLRYLRVRCFFVQTAIRVHTTTFIIIL